MGSRILPAARTLNNPIREFLKPGRRRTDHPLVVGFVVLALLFVSIVGACHLVLVWAIYGQMDRFLTEIATQQERSIKVDGRVLTAIEAQSQAISRLCVLGARTKEERQLCLPPPAPVIPPAAPAIVPPTNKKKGDE